MQIIMNQADQRWELVLARSGSADGKFVYAVKSTGIFCRPTCPSRRPRREMVEFFGSPDEAQRAGYRPCRRCEPVGQRKQLRKIEEACRFIDANLETTLNLEKIAAHAGLSPFHFQRLFKTVLGISPRQYQQARRAGKLRESLLQSARITDAIYDAGYGSSSRVYEGRSSQLGMTPSDFRRKGKGMMISYTVTDTDLGKMLIAATERGVCSVQFGDSAAALLGNLKSEYSAAELNEDRNGLTDLRRKVSELLQGATLEREIPLDIQGTAFQKLVWDALQRIPRGETRTYEQVAQAIGKPKAIRAVARACASNRAALVIPCHRVIQKTGGLAGYRWGTQRKRALLENEARRRDSMTKSAQRG